MVTTRIEPYDVSFNSQREAVHNLARDYKKIAQQILAGELPDMEPGVPWHDERFRRMLSGMAATQAYEAEQFRNIAHFVKALIK